MIIFILVQSAKCVGYYVHRYLVNLKKHVTRVVVDYHFLSLC